MINIISYDYDKIIYNPPKLTENEGRFRVGRRLDPDYIWKESVELNV